MHFDFDQDRLLFRDSVRAVLAKECTAAKLRELAESETGRSKSLWKKLADIGLLGLRVPEAHGGLALDEIDFVLPLEETGRAALAEPVVECAAIAAPLLAEIETGAEPGARAQAARCLDAIATGAAVATVGHERNPFVADAHVADVLLLQHGDEVHAVAGADTSVRREASIDPLRRLHTVAWTPRDATRLAHGDTGRMLWERAFDRGALATAAQQLGIAQQLVDMAVAYACTREQFGQPIGAFQAIKHMLADVAVRIEFARPVVYRAAFCVAHDAPERAVAVSHAKVAAGEAAARAAKTALQVHGAIGYTWEVDLHFWMKRAWSLDLAWGRPAWHRERIAQALLDTHAPAPAFGFEAKR
jgi:alkylation response protein AidB-like acyl-CoA dehydrogenase